MHNISVDHRKEQQKGREDVARGSFLTEETHSNTNSSPPLSEEIENFLDAETCKSGPKAYHPHAYGKRSKVYVIPSDFLYWTGITWA
jgi:hypothetical protein